MAWWYAIPAVVSAASSIYGGISSANAAKAEASRADAYAAYNSRSSIIWGNQQATMISAMGQYNAALMKQQAQHNIKLNQSSIEYNAKTMQAVNDYNQIAYDAEIDSLMDKLELDSQLLHLDYAKAVGGQIAQQGASGTVIGEGSNQEVINSIRTEEALNDLVLSTNAKNNATAILNEAAISDYNTDVAIQKMQFEGKLADSAMMYSANANAGAALIQSGFEAISARQTGLNRATEFMISGGQVSASQRTQAASYTSQGLMQAGSSLISAYGNYKVATS